MSYGLSLLNALETTTHYFHASNASLAAHAASSVPPAVGRLGIIHLSHGSTDLQFDYLIHNFNFTIHTS